MFLWTLAIIFLKFSEVVAASEDSYYDDDSNYFPNSELKPALPQNGLNHSRPPLRSSSKLIPNISLRRRPPNAPRATPRTTTRRPTTTLWPRPPPEFLNALGLMPRQHDEDYFSEVLAPRSGARASSTSTTTEYLLNVPPNGFYSLNQYLRWLELNPRPRTTTRRTQANDDITKTEEAIDQELSQRIRSPGLTTTTTTVTPTVPNCFRNGYLSEDHFMSCFFAAAQPTTRRLPSTGRPRPYTTRTRTTTRRTPNRDEEDVNTRKRPLSPKNEDQELSQRRRATSLTTTSTTIGPTVPNYSRNGYLSEQHRQHCFWEGVQTSTRRLPSTGRPGGRGRRTTTRCPPIRDEEELNTRKRPLSPKNEDQELSQRRRATSLTTTSTTIGPTLPNYSRNGYMSEEHRQHCFWEGVQTSTRRLPSTGRPGGRGRRTTTRCPPIRDEEELNTRKRPLSPKNEDQELSQRRGAPSLTTTTTTIGPTFPNYFKNGYLSESHFQHCFWEGLQTSTRRLPSTGRPGGRGRRTTTRCPPIRDEEELNTRKRPLSPKNEDQELSQRRGAPSLTTTTTTTGPTLPNYFKNGYLSESHFQHCFWEGLQTSTRRLPSTGRPGGRGRRTTTRCPPIRDEEELNTRKKPLSPKHNSLIDRELSQRMRPPSLTTTTTTVAPTVPEYYRNGYLSEDHFRHCFFEAVHTSTRRLPSTGRPRGSVRRIRTTTRCPPIRDEEELRMRIMGSLSSLPNSDATRVKPTIDQELSQRRRPFPLTTTTTTFRPTVPDCGRNGYLSDLHRMRCLIQVLEITSRRLPSTGRPVSLERRITTTTRTNSHRDEEELSIRKAPLVLRRNATSLLRDQELSQRLRPRQFTTTTTTPQPTIPNCHRNGYISELQHLSCMVDLYVGSTTRRLPSTGRPRIRSTTTRRTPPRDEEELSLRRRDHATYLDGELPNDEKIDVRRRPSLTTTSTIRTTTLLSPPIRNGFLTDQQFYNWLDVDELDNPPHQPRRTRRPPLRRLRPYTTTQSSNRQQHDDASNVDTYFLRVQPRKVNHDNEVLFRRRPPLLTTTSATSRLRAIRPRPVAPEHHNGFLTHEQYLDWVLEPGITTTTRATTPPRGSRRHDDYGNELRQRRRPPLPITSSTTQESFTMPMAFQNGFPNDNRFSEWYSTYLSTQAPRTRPRTTNRPHHDDTYPEGLRFPIRNEDEYRYLPTAADYQRRFESISVKNVEEISQRRRPPGNESEPEPLNLSIPNGRPNDLEVEQWLATHSTTRAPRRRPSTTRRPYHRDTDSSLTISLRRRAPPSTTSTTTIRQYTIRPINGFLSDIERKYFFFHPRTTRRTHDNDEDTDLALRRITTSPRSIRTTTKRNGHIMETALRKLLPPSTTSTIPPEKRNHKPWPLRRPGIEGNEESKNDMSRYAISLRRRAPPSTTSTSTARTSSIGPRNGFLTDIERKYFYFNPPTTGRTHDYPELPPEQDFAFRRISTTPRFIKTTSTVRTRSSRPSRRPEIDGDEEIDMRRVATNPPRFNPYERPKIDLPLAMLVRARTTTTTPRVMIF